MQNEPVEVTLKVTGAFKRLGVPYLIGSSLASTLYGMVRIAQDSDIVAKMRLEHLLNIKKYFFEKLPIKGIDDMAGSSTQRLLPQNSSRSM